MVSVINRNPNEVVNAIYLSQSNELPGEFVLQARDISTDSFTIEAGDSTTGSLFSPSLPPAPGAPVVEGVSENRANRIFFSKLQQPEAVPLLNFIDVGPQDQAISRILALRESLFILKEDGIYRLTGLNGAFVVDLFDESTRIISPDSAVVLNNQIYCLTNQGVAVISDTGVDIISKRLDNIFQVITSSSYDFRLTSFGISYETDRSYWLYVPSNPNDTVATQAFRYNTAEDSWTRQPISKTCGVVNRGDDKMYLGPADENFIERERKNFNRTDYADRDFAISIPTNSVEGNSVTLSQSNLAEVGDALVQDQFVTVNQYNQLLRKLDLDPFTGSPEIFTVSFENYTGSIGDLNNRYFRMSSASDSILYSVFFDNTGNVMSLDTNIFTDIRNSIQIRVDTSQVATLEELANATQNAIRTSTQDFVVVYSVGQRVFEVSTVRNGQTTDPADGSVSPVGSGFSLTVSTQGAGDFFSDLEAVAGDTIRNKINNLASKLDLDPSVVDEDYLSSISSFSSTFQDSQLAFNVIVNKLNLDEGVLYTNYLPSEGTSQLEVLIDEATLNNSTVTVQFAVNILEGPVTLFKGINCEIIYAPETFGDPSLLKQVREGTFMFENSTFTRGTVGYRSDLSPGIETIPFNRSGKGDWGSFAWSNQNWGGGFSGVPFRTYIPRSKQRCRYIQSQFVHNSAREGWAIFGTSYTLRAVSERAYRS